MNCFDISWNSGDLRKLPVGFVTIWIQIHRIETEQTYSHTYLKDADLNWFLLFSLNVQTKVLFSCTGSLSMQNDESNSKILASEVSLSLIYLSGVTVQQVTTNEAPLSLSWTAIIYV